MHFFAYLLYNLHAESFTGGGIGRPTLPWRQTLPTPSTETSSGGHCSGRYASYWNAFLFRIILTFTSKKPFEM